MFQFKFSKKPKGEKSKRETDQKSNQNSSQFCKFFMPKTLKF